GRRGRNRRACRAALSAPNDDAGAGDRLPLQPRALRHEIRPGEHGRALPGARSSRARVSVDPDRRHQRQGLGRRDGGRGARGAGVPLRALHVAAPAASRGAVLHRGTRRGNRSPGSVCRAHPCRGRRPDGLRRARGAADLLRVHDGGRVRSVPRRARRRRRDRGRPRRPPRRHERRDAGGDRHRGDRLRSPGAARRHAGVDRRREGRHHQAGDSPRLRRHAARRDRRHRADRGGSRRAAPDDGRRCRAGGPPGGDPARARGGASAAQRRRRAAPARDRRRRSAARPARRRSGTPRGPRDRTLAGAPRDRRLPWTARAARCGAQPGRGAGARVLSAERVVRRRHARVRRDEGQGRRGDAARAGPGGAGRRVHDRAVAARDGRRGPARDRALARARRLCRRGSRGGARSRVRRPAPGCRRGLDLPDRRAPGAGAAVILFTDPRRVMLRTTLLILAILGASVLPARAQGAPQMGGCTKWEVKSDTLNNVNETHTLLYKDVHIDCNDIQLFADQVELFSDVDRMIATGNVVFVSGTSRISAERMAFNTRTKTGTFFTASGIANLENRGIERSLFGSQEPDAYFWGETVEKLGPKTYKITHGGFTTCVQPTPRWELVANSVTLTLEKHAVLTSTVLKVKDVPVFYLPAMYYPINKEDRATGFLMPIYSSSTIKGQSIKNAFFWAMDRSHDATFYHDFYSKTGQGFGGEYRYVQSPFSSGNVQTYVLREHDAQYTQSNGTVTTQPGIDSYQINGSVQQSMSQHMRLTGTANYFSSLVSQQRYQQSIYAATNPTRSFGLNALGNWGANTISGTVERNEPFADVNSEDWNVIGSLPRVTFSRGEKRIGSLPIYFGLTSEFASLIRTDKKNNLVNERGLARVDLFPGIRFPFTKWPYLTFNTAFAFRETYWTESLDNAGTRVPDPTQRHYCTLTSTITGPVFTRVWNTPNRTYAQKFKHVIEPAFRVSRVTPIDNSRNIVRLDNTDYVVGRVTSFQYGLNNRLYAKKENAREIMSVAITQSYYTETNAAAVDREYQSSTYNTTPKPNHFSPVALQARVSPTPETDATFRTEYDTQFHALRTLAANGGLREGWVNASAGWSQTRYIPG